jgi:hypothetical protein
MVERRALTRTDAPFPLAIRDVHRDFHAEAEIDRLWCFPFHAQAPEVDYATTADDAEFGS